ncbi:MAG: single-stranded DNA-binding protein [Blastocatellia bacterium]
MPAYAQITGRIGQDPSLHYTHGGTPVVNLSVASQRQKRDAEGERVQGADWYRVSLFGRNAELIAEYARKGSALAFNGRLQLATYLDRAGVERTATCLIADSFEFMPGDKRDASERESVSAASAEEMAAGEIPF